MNTNDFVKMDLPEDVMLLFAVQGDDIFVVKEDRDTTLRKLARDLSLFHVVGLCARAGVGEFFQKLEHEHYPPSDKARNDLMQTRQVKWKGHHWIIQSFPFDERQKCYDMAKQVKMRFEKEGAYPMVVASRIVLTSKSVESVRSRLEPLLGPGLSIDEFPLRSGQMVVLICAEDSVTYKGRGGNQDDMHSEAYRMARYYDAKGIRRR